MRVELQFYHYDDLKPWLSRWSRLRLWLQSKVSEHVHCNVVKDGVIHELAAWGGSLDLPPCSMPKSIGDSVLVLAAAGMTAA